MKWFGSIMTSLVIAALTAIFLAYLQPIVRVIAPDQVIEARIELSRWEERPAKAGVATEKQDDDYVVKAKKDVFRLRDFYDFAAITLDNPTPRVIENLRIRFGDDNARDALIISDDGLTRISIKDGIDFKLPDMKPGDRVKVFMWGDNQFPKRLIADQLKTYSSAGPDVPPL